MARRYFMVRAIVFTLLLVLGLGTANAHAEDLKTSRRKILVLVNAERKKHSLAPLKPDAKLNEAAQKFADALAKGAPFKHDRWSLQRRLESEGLNPEAAAENIAYGMDRAESAHE